MLLLKTLQSSKTAVFKVQPKFFSYKASAAEVKKLREMTSSPMGDCVKALNANNGDFEKAKEFLRKKGLAYAEKRADRFTTQGLVGLQESDKSVSMVQFACETDFVAKTDKFREGLEAILDTVCAQNGKTFESDCDPSSLSGLSLVKSLDPDAQQMNIEEGVKYVISKT